MIEEYPIVLYIKDCYPLNDKKIKFIESNCSKLSLVENSEEVMLLDIKLPIINSKYPFRLVDNDNFNHLGDIDEDNLAQSSFFDKEMMTEHIKSSMDRNSNSLKEYYSYYDKLINCLKDSFESSGFVIMISSTISKTQGLKFYLIDSMTNNQRSCVMDLLINEHNECVISNTYLEGSFSISCADVFNCIEKLSTLDFIKIISYESSIDNKSYNTLSKLGYSTLTGVLVPKTKMYKKFK